ncbi:SpoIVB peptidase S55 domain-containing protein [Atrimonas thermophila]|uniref:SpoIVB peptidase S55 domain-containing protein n=1 Tax=Atrimonas thermophila TaxID=3064161 RepID=UPI00399CB1AB
MPSKRVGIFLFLLFLAIFFWLLPLVEAEEPGYLPLSEVKIGMRGYGKTVFYGTRVETFDLEVIDVVSGKSIEDAYFVIRITDDRVKELGGISAGMSGSPIFLKDRIAGALAYGYESRDNLIGVVTPIEAMLSLWGSPGTRKKEQRSLMLAMGLGQRAASFLEQHAPVRVALAFPQLFRGRSSGMTSTVPELVPGSAIGVQLLSGDADILSIGTLTYLDGDKFLALGHPFLHYGKVAYFLSSVYVNFSVSGKDFPFKVGTPIEVVGIVEEDRQSGIAGRIGVLPDSCDLQIVARDRNGSLQSFNFKVVQDERVLADVLPSLFLDVLDRVLDCQCSGTIVVSIKLHAQDFSFEDRFFWTSKTDVAAEGANGLDRFLRGLSQNPFFEFRPQRISLEFEHFPYFGWGKLGSLSCPASAEQGKFIEGEVTVFPYRRETITFPFRLPVPDNFPSGRAEIVIWGKGSESESRLEDTGTPMNIKEYLEKITASEKRNGFKIELRSLENESAGSYLIEVPVPLLVEGSLSQEVLIGR